MLRKGEKMKNNWRKIVTAFCAATMLMTMPGMSVYAADPTHEDVIESFAATAEVVDEPGDILEEDINFEEPEIIEEVEVPNPEEEEDAAETVDLPQEDSLTTEEEPIEELVGATYTVGDGVKATFFPDTGTIAIFNNDPATSGTLWPDWLEKAQIDRKSVKKIYVPQINTYRPKKVKLPADCRGLGEPLEYYLFGQLENLTEIDFSGFSTSNVTDMSYMFYYCTSLETVDLSSFNTSKVTSMESMFMGCENLTSVNLSGFNTSKVTNMSGMFNDCNSLKSVDLSSFDTSSVRDMSHMFAWCTGLKTLDVSNFKTSNVTDMGSMFFACESLTRLDLRNFNTSKVTDMFYMFQNCPKLKYLDIGSFDMSKSKDKYLIAADVDALEILITPKTVLEPIHLKYTMYDRNGKKYDEVPANSKSMVLGRTQALAASIFIDVRDPSHPYYDAIYWAAGEGITKGYSDGTFGINRSCTRGEMVMFLWRYAGKPTPKAVRNSPFKDVPKTHTFFVAILWAYQRGITKGYSDGTFGINRNVTRGESMMFLWRLKGKPEPIPVLKSPFSDVPQNHVFYKAILWGYQKKVTTGYVTGLKKGTFGINENCTRGQIVTFLYRARNL